METRPPLPPLARHSPNSQSMSACDVGSCPARLKAGHLANLHSPSILRTRESP